MGKYVATNPDPGLCRDVGYPPAETRLELIRISKEVPQLLRIYTIHDCINNTKVLSNINGRPRIPYYDLRYTEDDSSLRKPPTTELMLSIPENDLRGLEFLQRREAHAVAWYDSA